MKFSIPAPELKAALSRCAKVAERRGFIPIIANVRIEAGDRLKIRATNLNTYVAVDLPADIAIRGEICAPADELLKFAAAAGKAVMAVEVSGNALRLSWGRSSAALNTLPADDFPMAWGDSADLRPVDGALLISALNYCAPAAQASGGTNEYLQGVCLRDTPEGARIYGTNSIIAHRAVTPGVRFGGSAIIPNGDIALICDLTGPMRFFLSENKWGASGDGCEVWGRVIDGTFPDADQVITEMPLASIVDREALIEAVSLAAIGMDDAARNPAVAIDIRDGSIYAHGLNRGAALASGARAEIDADTRQDCVGAFGAKSLLTMLAALEVDIVAITSSGNLSMVVEPVEQRTEIRRTAIIMGRRYSAQELAA